MSLATVRLTERFEQSTLPMALVALDGSVLSVNAAMCGLVGRSREELEGCALADLACDADLADSARRDLDEALGAGRSGGEFVQRLRGADGAPVHVRVHWTLVRDEQGTPSYLTTILVDETERLAVASAEARGAARFRARFDGSSVAQTFCDVSGRFSAVNDAACALLGRERCELVGHPLRALTHPQDTGAADAVLRDVLAGRTEAAQVERVMLGAGGRPVPVLVDVSLMRDSDGRIEGAAAFLHDLSALRAAEARRQEQEDLFLAIGRRSSDLALVSDAEGRISFATASLSHVFGYDVQDVVGRTGWDFVHPDDVEAARAAFGRVVRDGGTTVFLLRVRDADGQWRWIEETVTNLLDTPLAALVANLRDVTERVAAEAALRASEARYRAIVDTAEEGIWAASQDGRTLYANARMAAILGVPLEEVYARPVVELFPAGERAALRTRFAGRAERGPERYEQVYLHPDGGERRLWVSASPLPDADAGVAGSLAMISDVTDARRLEAQLEHAALHDALTGLPNRALLQDRLEHALARDDEGTAVLFLDLDHFGLVNESQGHEVGDGLLAAVATRLAEAVRPGDTLGRFGGDEFVVVCEDVDETAATRVAEGLLAALSAPFDVDGQVHHVAASVGVALSPAPSAGDLLRYADAATRSAKLEGRGRVRRFDLALTEQAEQRSALSAELREALARDELVVHYQPVVDLDTGDVVGLEALTRWTSPERGPVRPDVFVAVAELTGLAPDLDRWVVRRALHDVGLLRLGGAVPAEAFVAVNLSPSSLDRELEPLLVAAAAAAGLEPADVVLEITEGSIMQDAAAAIEVLSRLRAHGFRVAVDDFGTGYSSLAYLRDLPVTSLKIDRSFVAGIATDRDALAIVASIVDLARAVDISVVAEGVETAEQAAVLRRLGCRSAQGWLWSPAMAPGDLTASRTCLRPFLVAQRQPETGAGRAPRTRPVLAEHGLERLLELHRSGASLATVASALNAEGFRTPSGTRWHRTSVARAVADAAYPSLGGPSGP